MKGRENMLNKEVVKLLNEQITKEFYSAYLYMDMANSLIEELNLFGKNMFILNLI